MHYLHIKNNTKKQVDTFVTLSDGVNNRKIFFQANDTISYSNIVISKTFNSDSIIVENPMNLDIEYFFTPSQIFTQEQIQYDSKYNIIEDDELFYSYKEGTHSKLIVTFPGFIGFTNEVKYPITYLSDVNDCHKLCFQDRYFMNGSYMFVDNDGNKLLDKILNKIKFFMKKYSIVEEDILFFGTSKGGTIAINIGSHFPSSTILAIAPQYDFNSFCYDQYIFGSLMDHLLSEFFIDNNIDYTKMLDLRNNLHKIKSNSQSLLTFDGFNDLYSNTVYHPNSRQYMQSHNEVIQSRKDEYLHIIKQFTQNELLTLRANACDYSYYSGVTKEKYANVDFENNTSLFTYIKIYIDNKVEYIFNMKPNSKGKYYNIVIPENAHMDIKAINDSLINVKIDLSNTRKYTAVEIDDMVNDVHEKNLYYKYKEQPNAKKLLVVFSGFQDESEQHQYMAYNLNNIDNNYTNKLIFRDNYFVSGTYMLTDDYGKPVIPNIVQKISETAKQMGILEEDIIIWGASKGGTIASMLIEYFLSARFVIIVPQLDFDVYKKSRLGFNNNVYRFMSTSFSHIKAINISEKLSMLNNKSIVIEAFDDYTSRLEFTNNNILKCELHQANLMHHLVTRNTLTYWQDFIQGNNEENIMAKIYRQGSKIRDIEFIANSLPNCEDYAKIHSFIQFIDTDTNEIKFSTRVGRKTAVGMKKIDVFCVKDINLHLSSFSHLSLEKEIYKLQVIVFLDGKKYIITLNDNNRDILYIYKQDKIVFSKPKK